MFPIFAIIFALNFFICLAAAGQSVKWWKRIRSVESARQYGILALPLGFLGLYFAALSWPQLLQFDGNSVAAAYVVAQPFLFLALAGASCTVIGFVNYRWSAAIFFVVSGFWFTYWRIYDFEPAVFWSGFGLIQMEPIVRPIYKLLVAVVVSVMLGQMIKQAHALKQRNVEPFSARQFRYFEFGALGFLGSVLAYHVLGALGALSLVSALILAAPLSLVGAGFFYRALRAGPYVPAQFEQVGGILQKNLPP